MLGQVDAARTALLFNKVVDLRFVLAGKKGHKAQGYQLLKEVSNGVSTYIQTGPKMYGSFMFMAEDSMRDCVSHRGGVLVERCENLLLLTNLLTPTPWPDSVSNAIRVAAPCLLGASGDVTHQPTPNFKVVTWGSRGNVRLPPPERRPSL